MISPKLQKASLFTILGLLLLFVPLSFYGMYLKFLQKPINIPKENVNKELYFDGKLWFYNDLGEILGTYTCENPYCSYAISTNHDEDYSILSYKNESEDLVFLPIVNNQYVFITDSADFDGTDVYLYDIQNEMIYNKENPYLLVNNYTVGLQENLFIVETKENQYNVLSLDNFGFLFEKDYDFIGVIDDGLDGQAKNADYFVVKDQDEWKIIDQKEAVLSTQKESIVTYNGEYVITNSNKNYHVVRYDGESVLDGDYSSLSFVGKYLCVTTKQNEFYIYDFVLQSPISEYHDIKRNDVVKSVLTDSNEIQIYVNEELVETVPTT